MNFAASDSDDIAFNPNKTIKIGIVAEEGTSAHFQRAAPSQAHPKDYGLLRSRPQRRQKKPALWRACLFERSARGRPTHSHSIVAGGFPLMSYTTRDTPRTSLMIRFETRPRKSYGRCAQWAVMKSMVSTARSEITHS